MANKNTIQITATMHLTTKLTTHNYHVWRKQVGSTLISPELEEFIIGTSKQPPKEINDKDGKQINSPKYLPWFHKDQMIFNVILRSCS